MELARQYYACDDIQGVYLENEGGSGTARLDKILYMTEQIANFLLALIRKEELFIMN